jgi:hypothetical protein
MATEKNSSKEPKFVCDYCNFMSSSKTDWERHIARPKHKNRVFGNDIATEKQKKTYVCDCGKNYVDRTGLWKHKHHCDVKINVNNEGITSLTNLVLEVVKSNNELQKQNQEMQKQNQEMQKQILDVCKKGIINTTNNVNSHNKTFNLQVFLNEDCKDAMNITDFVDSIKFQLADLEHMGQVGYVEGISNIIIKNMKALDITKRPVHCTDQKRETIYIKDEGVWIKEEEDNKNVRKLIKRVAFRNSKCIRLFKEKYPDCVTSESRYSDTYNKIVLEAMGGGPKCDDYESENKIIKKLSKIVTIDKYNL